VKNTLAVVQGIAARPSPAAAAWRGARRPGPPPARLANAHGLLTASEWRGASLAALVGDELEPYDGAPVCSPARTSPSAPAPP
jgi:hypothetical protein